MLINFVDATKDANHYTKPPPEKPNYTSQTHVQQRFTIAEVAADWRDLIYSTEQLSS